MNKTGRRNLVFPRSKRGRVLILVLLVTFAGLFTWNQLQARLADQSLRVAVRSGDITAARKALEHGANPNLSVARRTALDILFMQNLSLPARFSASWRYAHSPRSLRIWPALFHAIENHNAEMAALLISQGADVNARGPRDLTPLMFAVTNSDTHSHTKIVSLLIKSGAKTDDTTRDGMTALRIAQGWSRQVDRLRGPALENVGLLKTAGAKH